MVTVIKLHLKKRGIRLMSFQDADFYGHQGVYQPNNTGNLGYLPYS